ncbi:uncharacterized protein LTR77_007656 [Saxophila tyrrhenica]|uniref:Uncharacterized protein n=1 Tax=Saxophila tyrrhenica TaxID=1690608 RepID=A0AAV9P5M8_9PEZI|nr:hypothetical protein LTR77_007656 [Saxophila tyrrhenica]
MSQTIQEKLPSFAFDQAIQIQTQPNTGHQPHHTHDVQGEQRVRQAIKAAAQRNTALLSQLMATADAMTAFANSEVNVDKTREELAVQDSLVEKIELEAGVYRIRVSERRKFLTRWFYILTRMRRQLDEKISGAEKTYRNAVVAQSQAEKRQQALRRDLAQTEKEHSVLGDRAKQHATVHEELDKLYKSIFSGPTPGFPDEDELEARYNAKHEKHTRDARSLKLATKSSKEASAIGRAIDMAMDELEKAQDEATSPFFGSNYATQYIRRAALFVQKAEELNNDLTQSLVKPIDRSLIAMHKRLSEYFALARKTATEGCDGALHAGSDTIECIEQVRSELSHASEAQDRIKATIRGYHKNATRAVATGSRELEDARQALHGIRQNAFEKTVGFGAAAPAYHECCDRAKGFVDEAVAESAPVTDEGMPPPPTYEKVVEEE